MYLWTQCLHNACITPLALIVAFICYNLFIHSCHVNNLKDLVAKKKHLQDSAVQHVLTPGMGYILMSLPTELHMPQKTHAQINFYYNPNKVALRLNISHYFILLNRKTEYKLFLIRTSFLRITRLKSSRFLRIMLRLIHPNKFFPMVCFKIAASCRRTTEKNVLWFIYNILAFGCNTAHTF